MKNYTRYVVLIIGILIFSETEIFSQTIGDYRSKATGNYNTAGTWEVYSVTGWTNASTAPSATTFITILSGHTVTLTTASTTSISGFCANLTINSGGILTVSQTGSTGVTSLTISGNINISGSMDISKSGGGAGTISVTVSGSATVNSGGNLNISKAGAGTANPTLTANGVLIVNGSVSITASATLNVTQNVTIYGNLSNSGSFMFPLPAGTKTFELKEGATYTHDAASLSPFDNASEIFWRSTDSPSNLSNLVVTNWTGYANNPLAANMNGHYGNLSIGTGNANDWHQTSQFRTHDIKGTLTIGNASLYLDDGTGTSGASSIGNIIINNANSKLVLLAPTVLNIPPSSTGDFTFNVGNITISNGLLIGTTNYYTILGATVAGTLALNASSLIMTGGIFQGTDATGYIGGASTTTTLLNLNFSSNISMGGGNFYGSYSGLTFNNGNVNITGSPDLSITAGVFTGISQSTTATSTAQTLTVTMDAINFSSGSTGAFYGVYPGNGVSAVTINANSVSMSGGTFAGLHNSYVDGTANGTATLNISSNISLTGSSLFAGSMAGGTGGNGSSANGNVNIYATTISTTGNSLFAGAYTSVGASVNANGNISINPNASPGTLNVSVLGASTFAGTYKTVNTESVSGSVTINLSQLNFTAGSPAKVILTSGTGPVTATIGIYNQTGSGTFYMHNDATNANNNVISLTISNTFTQSNGTFDMDDNSASGVRSLIISGSLMTLSGATITKSGASAAIPGNYGQLIYSGSSITYNRNSTFVISKIKQIINPGSTLSLDVSSGNFLISSAQVTGTDYLTINGTLDLLQNKHIYAINGGALVRSGISIGPGGTLKTGELDGFYDSTNNAALEGNLGSANSMDFNLDANSIIEYNGTDNQKLTGWGIGVANQTQHKYGKLNINFSGSANAEWVYPTSATGKVYVRTQLNLQAGELNLDGDGNHSAADGGQTLIVENSATSAIIRTSGYIRSEIENNSGKIKWYMGAVAGTRIFPLAKSSAAADYIPLNFDLTGGIIDTVTVSTYGTGTNNLPYPASVTDVNDATGADNSANTVDRFWQINKTGPSGTATITFSYVLNEEPSATGSSNPLRLQHWNGTDWVAPLPSQTYVLASGTSAGTITAPAVTIFSIWTASKNSSPLPIELVNFNARKNNNTVDINWTTASEINNNYFIVERSKDGINFTELLKVKSLGNSAILRKYSVLDNDPFEGNNYYRLKQVDFDGKFEFGPIEIINFSNFSADIGLLVNKDNKNLKVSFQNMFPGNYVFKIMDLTGRDLISNSIFISEGSSSIEISNVDLPFGIYLLNIINSSQTKTLKFIY